MNKTETIEAKLIQDFLASQEKVPLTDDPQYRLQWSDDDYELRLVLDGPHAGEVKSCRKYPFVHHRWMFQRWMPPELMSSLDLPESNNGSYETLYVFQDKHGKALPLNQKVIEFMLYYIRRPASSMLVKSVINDEMLAMDEKFDKYFDNEVETSSDVISLLHSGEAIQVPSNFGVKQ